MNAMPQGEGLAILVVDDETLITMLLEDVLLDLGCTVVGPAATVAQSLALVEGDRVIDGALLDILTVSKIARKSILSMSYGKA
jgi:CheY-like chemotaxis protein